MCIFFSDGSVNDWGYLFTVEAIKGKGGGTDAMGGSRGDTSVPLTLPASIAMESYFHLRQLMLDGPGSSPGSCASVQPKSHNRQSGNEDKKGGDVGVTFDAYPMHTHCIGYVDYYQTIADNNTTAVSTTSTGLNPPSTPTSSSSSSSSSSSAKEKDKEPPILPKNPKYLVADSHQALALGLTTGGTGGSPSPCPEVLPVELMRISLDDPYTHLAEAGDHPVRDAYIDPLSFPHIVTNPLSEP